MKTMTITGRAGLSLLLFFAGLLSFAAPQARADEEKDPPTRVARISFVEGSVSLQPGGQGDWGAAARNRPVTIGDKIWVDKDSRAELQAGTVSIHLGSMTALSFLNLDAGITQMRLAEGSVNFRVSEMREGDVYEVDAPNVAFTVKQAGAFRIDVNENGDSARVTVIRGEGEVAASGKTYPVHAEERAEFTGTDNVEPHFERAPGPDGLDIWAEQRDRKEDNSVSGKYVSPDIPGRDDLDDNGDWRDEPEYGHVWYPREVEPDWAPYSYGSWNYVSPWGWTWVGYEPWGFAPYHYGRWSYIGGRWGWCPGAFYGPAIYGPAFVGFFGGGFGFGVGWFPLGWGEPFYPWYHCHGGYIRNINIHNTYIRNVNVINNRNFNYVNAHNVHAVTTANRNAFTSGHLINRGAGAGHITEASLRGARVNNSVGIKPTQHSALGSENMRANVARPSASIQNRTVVARTAPAQGASQARVRTFNSAGLTPGRTGNSPIHNSPAMNGRAGNAPGVSGMSSRQQELSNSRPPSTMNNSNRNSSMPAGNTGSQRAGNNTRTWEAQGNTSDRGRAPAGFGSASRMENAPAQSARSNDTNRPPWAHSGAQTSGPNGQGSRPSAPAYNNNRAPSYNNNRNYSDQRSYSPPPSRSNAAPRTYTPPSRSYPAPSRSYSAPAPSRSYSAPAPSHSYSAPSHSYSAPSRSYSAPPSHSSGGGGGSPHGGGGGSPHGGGGGGSHGRH
ncbi:MAG TPA: DUF6600 domain-containing protein [Candidatus Acidoferrum sp.]|nr:DUF6600 domain-containing protein [Candidatus Acidoferrum sp.]